MIKKLAIFVLGLTSITATVSCNEDSTITNEVDYASTMVKSFKIDANDKLLSHLDSVFFSIDLVNAQIFNADSLPFGTDVSKLVVKLTTDACSTIELKVPRQNAADTVINYMTNATDSINFANGAVTLHLVSYDRKATRDYTIKVNVHKVKPDSLYWNRMAVRKLPSAIDKPTLQKSVKLGDKAVCLTSDGSIYSIATTDLPAGNNWQTATVTFPFTPDIESLAATARLLYILSDDGILYSSTDEGKSWSSTGETWTHIYGGYGDRLLGVSERNGKPCHVTFPPSSEKAVPDGCPIEGTSTLATISNKWSTSSQVIMVGGKLADGTSTSNVWGYDGNSWACISKKFPAKISGVSLFPYYVAQTDSASWSVKQIPALIALCGEVDGTPSSTVYISRDMGVNWKKGDELLQLPEYIAARTDAQPLIFDTLFTSRSDDGWTCLSSRPLPRWWSIANESGPLSRATTPITEWECPYIYLFGGYDANGKLFDTVWKGVINRLTFKPLQ